MLIKGGFFRYTLDKHLKWGYNWERNETLLLGRTSLFTEVSGGEEFRQGRGDTYARYM